MAKITVKCPSCASRLAMEKMEGNQPLTCPQCQFRTIASQFLEIVMKKVVCPYCGTALSIDSEFRESVKCPKPGCKYSGDIGSYRPYNDGVTVVPGKPESGSRFSRPAVLTLAAGHCADKIILLKKGRNTIGRESSGSKCSIQLRTEDDFISRKHACIELREKADGTLEYHLSDAGSTNGTWHNGDRVGKSEVVILKLEDTIRFGHTTFKFTME